MMKPVEDSQRGKNGVIQNKIDDKNENGSLIPMNSAFDIDQENKGLRYIGDCKTMRNTPYLYIFIANDAGYFQSLLLKTAVFHK